MTRVFTSVFFAALLLLQPACGHGAGSSAWQELGRLRELRGGSSAVVGTARSPLKSFIRQATASAGIDSHGGFPSVTLCPPAHPSHAAAAAPPSAVVLDVDEEGDSLMGPPAAAHAAPGAGGGAHIPSGTAQLRPVPWGQGKGVPFKYICSKLLAMEAGEETRIVHMLLELVNDVWQHAPEDLAMLVCLLRDQILSPTLQGVELLPAAHLNRVVADALAKTPEGLRDSLAAFDGDLAVTVQKLRGSQRTLFPPSPLTLSRVLVSLRDVAERRCFLPPPCFVPLVSLSRLSLSRNMLMSFFSSTSCYSQGHDRTSKGR